MTTPSGWRVYFQSVVYGKQTLGDERGPMAPGQEHGFTSFSQGIDPFWLSLCQPDKLLGRSVASATLLAPGYYEQRGAFFLRETQNGVFMARLRRRPEEGEGERGRRFMLVCARTADLGEWRFGAWGLMRGLTARPDVFDGSPPPKLRDQDESEPFAPFPDAVDPQKPTEAEAGPFFGLLLSALSQRKPIALPMEAADEKTEEAMLRALAAYALLRGPEGPIPKEAPSLNFCSGFSFFLRETDWTIQFTPEALPGSSLEPMPLADFIALFRARRPPASDGPIQGEIDEAPPPAPPVAPLTPDGSAPSAPPVRAPVALLGSGDPWKEEKHHPLPAQKDGPTGDTQAFMGKTVGPAPTLACAFGRDKIELFKKPLAELLKLRSWAPESSPKQLSSSDKDVVSEKIQMIFKIFKNISHGAYDYNEWSIFFRDGCSETQYRLDPKASRPLAALAAIWYNSKWSLIDHQAEREKIFPPKFQAEAMCWLLSLPWERFFPTRKDPANDPPGFGAQAEHWLEHRGLLALICDAPLTARIIHLARATKVADRKENIETIWRTWIQSNWNRDALGNIKFNCFKILISEHIYIDDIDLQKILKEWAGSLRMDDNNSKKNTEFNIKILNSFLSKERDGEKYCIINRLYKKMTGR